MYKIAVMNQIVFTTNSKQEHSKLLIILAASNWSANISTNL